MTKRISRKKQLDLINDLKEKVKKHKVVKSILKEYGVDDEALDQTPVCFKKLDVSARTEYGMIYLNEDFLDGNILDEDHYLVHEFIHVLQQCYGDRPTKSSDSGDYLENKFEQEAFFNQTEYIADTKGEDVAEEYVENLLDHHEVEDEEEREEKKDVLYSRASRINFLLKIKA